MKSKENWSGEENIAFGLARRARPVVVNHFALAPESWWARIRSMGSVLQRSLLFAPSSFLNLLDTDGCYR